MASWMVHLRVADNLINKFNNLSIEDFIVGNIGPDCGEPNETWTEFTPPKEITHWKSGKDEKTISPELFYNNYFGEKNNDIKKFSFYIGYYVHLLTDVQWYKDILLPTKEKFKDEFLRDSNYEVFERIKGDWYDLDHLFIKENKDFYSFKIFQNLKHYNNNYLEYYSVTAIPKQISYISKFYNEEQDNLYREYIYLTEEEMNTFVERTCNTIENVLVKKGVL